MARPRDPSADYDRVFRPVGKDNPFWRKYFVTDAMVRGAYFIGPVVRHYLVLYGIVWCVAKWP
jgi:hypothetical protein